MFPAAVSVGPSPRDLTPSLWFLSWSWVTLYILFGCFVHIYLCTSNQCFQYERPANFWWQQKSVHIKVSCCFQSWKLIAMNRSQDIFIGSRLLKDNWFLSTVTEKDNVGLFSCVDFSFLLSKERSALCNSIPHDCRLGLLQDTKSNTLWCCSSCYRQDKPPVFTNGMRFWLVWWPWAHMSVWRIQCTCVN